MVHGSKTKIRKYENTRITIYSINQEMNKQQPDDLSLIKK